MKIFLFNAAMCNGCHACQIACKDEHCGNDWSPIAAPQPKTGQFWCKLEEREMGKTPFVHVDYTFEMCSHCDDCKLLSLAEGDGAVYRRSDGFVIIDPEKARGQRQLLDGCSHVFWNEELQVAQKCTGCAHLLDDGWSEPRCVDMCPTGALRYGEPSEMPAELMAAAVPSEPGSHLYYVNLPKRRIAGCVADRSVNEVVIGAKVTISDASGAVVASVETDEFGDFMFKGADEGAYTVRIEAAGYSPVELEASTVENDAVFPEVLLRR